MFTGIVEHMGVVSSAVDTNEGRRLAVDVGPLDGIDVGDSLSVSGVCLTAVAVDGPVVEVETVKETLQRTNLGELDTGSKVNLERAMPANGRFDGHIVQGHVDGVGRISAITAEGDSLRVSVEIPADLMRYVVEKGSITVDGVSLTVAGISGEAIEIAVIPHTLQVTTLGLHTVGNRVNLEVDILAKYVERIASRNE